MSTVTFDTLTFDVLGTETVVLTAGDTNAPPLVFLHGGGTFHGWRFAEPWTSSFRVLIPYHPGFGESGDMEGMRDIGDVVLHYVDLFDQLGLHDDVNLVGFSLGGRIAARFAIEQKHRLRRLVLVAPAGLRVPGVKVDDFFTIPPEELAPRLVHDMNTILPYLPEDPLDVDFTVDRYRETRTVAILTWEQPYDRVIQKWLPRVDTPTLVVWGEDDKLVPPALAQGWAAKLPDAQVGVFANAGHLVLDESKDAREAVARFCA